MHCNIKLEPWVMSTMNGDIHELEITVVTQSGRKHFWREVVHLDLFDSIFDVMLSAGVALLKRQIQEERERGKPHSQAEPAP